MTVHTFFLGLVRKHRAERDVTDALDALRARVELVVDHDATLVVQLNASSFEVKTFGVWTATNCDEDDVRLELWAISACFVRAEN